MSNPNESRNPTDPQPQFIPASPMPQPMSMPVQHIMTSPWGQMPPLPQPMQRCAMNPALAMGQGCAGLSNVQSRMNRADLLEKRAGYDELIAGISGQLDTAQKKRTERKRLKAIEKDLIKQGAIDPWAFRDIPEPMINDRMTHETVQILATADNTDRNPLVAFNPQLDMRRTKMIQIVNDQHRMEMAPPPAGTKNPIGFMQFMQDEPTLDN